MQLDFTLSFTDTQWICYNDSFKASANSLDEIDNQIEIYLRNKHLDGVFNIKMYFDFDRFPVWHRQYMPHYFNRSITFNLNKENHEYN